MRSGADRTTAHRASCFFLLGGGSRTYGVQEMSQHGDRSRVRALKPRDPLFKLGGLQIGDQQRDLVRGNSIKLEFTEIDITRSQTECLKSVNGASLYLGGYRFGRARRRALGLF